MCEMRDENIALRARAERAEAERDEAREKSIAWQERAAELDIERMTARRHVLEAQSTIADLTGQVERLREAIIPHIADLERTAVKIEVIDGFKKSADQFRLAASELRAALGGEKPTAPAFTLPPETPPPE